MLKYASNSYSAQEHAVTNSFVKPGNAIFRSANELDPVMPSLTHGAIDLARALTSLLQVTSEANQELSWNNNPTYVAPRHSVETVKDSATSAVRKSNKNAPVAKLSDEELAWKLQQEDFEFAYGRKADNKAGLIKTLQVEEDSYFAKSLQAKEEQEANEYAIAKLLREDADQALAEMLKYHEDANFALQLQCEEITNYSFANTIPSYNHHYVPFIGNDFTGYNFIAATTA